MSRFDWSADVIVNVEASHCYPSREKFFQHVFAALKFGGFFVFADFMPEEEVLSCIAWLEAAGFSIVNQEDITAQVLKAMKESDAAKMTVIQERMNPLMAGVLKR